MRHFAAAFILPLLVAFPAKAQDDETIYMGIDLTAEPMPVEGEPTQSSVDAAMLGVLEEGVELGCLAFEPPSTFSQTENDSAECREYIARLTAAASGEGSDEAEEAEQENPYRAIPLVMLAQAAQSGNKRAQLELGMRFEEGVAGVEQDWERAAQLYQQAGRATPARHGMRVSQSEAGVGGGVSRGVVSPRIPGLPEARERLEALEGRMEAGEE